MQRLWLASFSFFIIYENRYIGFIIKIHINAGCYKKYYYNFPKLKSIWKTKNYLFIY